MNVYINGRFAIQPKSGVQRYASEILHALDRRAAAGDGPEFILLSPLVAPNAGLTHIAQRWLGSSGGHAWEQWSFARAAADGVALSLAMSGPLFHPRQLVVIHDAAVHRHPEHFSRRYATAHRLLERRLAGRAAIATVSRFSRRELATVLDIDEAAILLAPNGADHGRVVPDATILGRLGVERPADETAPFFLTLGNLTPNKNVAVVQRALAHIADPVVRVVAVGQGQGRVFGTISLASDERLILPGRLADGEVAALMQSARALIFPSRYEGFGLPPLEAMANGCPVLASNCAAVIEVCGGAADLFAPDDDAALARLMIKVLADDGRWRAERIAAGYCRAQHYRWADSACVLAEACAELVGHGAR